jgi:hypothetical protein
MEGVEFSEGAFVGGNGRSRARMEMRMEVKRDFISARTRGTGESFLVRGGEDTSVTVTDQSFRKFIHAVIGITCGE